jgi:(S)-mandelate dehydrogenase
MSRKHYVGRDLKRAVTIEDLRRMAHRRLPRSSCEYLEGGAEDEVSLKRNRDVFERIVWIPRTLVGVAMPDTAVSIFGRRANLPVVIAPTGFNGLLWPRGDVALARAAATAGVPFTLSTVSNCAIETLAREAPGDNWFQLYPVKDQRALDRLVDRARDAGYGTLVVTTDVPELGAREWDQRNYRAPMKLGVPALLDMLAHPAWVWRVLLPGGVPRFENLVEFLPAGAERQSALLGARYLTTQMNPLFSWQDVARLRERWRGRLVLKGILSAEDARRAVELGADGIVLSNHGGRQLDSTISGVELLPAVAAELRDRTTLLVDGGFRRGSDILKAVALGAHAVMIGRATLYGLAAGGEAGVAHALTLLRAEMQRSMTLLGCRNMAEVNRQLVRS